MFYKIVTVQKLTKLLCLVVCTCRIYILAQLLASVLSCSIFAFVSGWGPLMPLKSYKDLNISWPEAMHMWMTGTYLRARLAVPCEADTTVPDTVYTGCYDTAVALLWGMP
jgi:hypothetical protein